ncbi:MAG: DMT family transporter [Actinomycetota bacterium]|nr:DMT family transporter [Actinomycetota bacterium]
MGSKKHSDAVVGCLCALGCEALFGLSYVFTKQATGVASAFALLGWRFLIAFAAMTVLVCIRVVKVDFKGKSLQPLLLVALFSPCLYFIGETVGISHTTASESGVFLACIPVASLVASALLLKKRPTRLQVTGILITLVGVLATVFAVGSSSSLSPVGYGFLLLAVASYALYTVSVDRAEDFSGMEITFAMLASGAAVFVTLALAEGAADGTLRELVTLPFRSPSFAVAAIYQGVGCSVAAFFLSNVAIARIGVNRTVSFIGVATVVSIAAGTLLLGEPFTVWQAVGATVIVAGVCTANAGTGA